MTTEAQNMRACYGLNKVLLQQETQDLVKMLLALMCSICFLHLGKKNKNNQTNKQKNIHIAKYILK